MYLNIFIRDCPNFLSLKKNVFRIIHARASRKGGVDLPIAIYKFILNRDKCALIVFGECFGVAVSRVSRQNRIKSLQQRW